MGAVLVNLQSGRFAQGGSTVTQQLARQSFLTLERSLTRKIKEAILAALIERTYSKQEILELYLNKVYFGDGFHGVEAAARGYFAKSAADLTVEEAALIAGIIKSPSTWAPTVNMDKAVARRNIVLATMLENGKIDRATFDRARHAPVHLQNGLQRDESFGQYFKEQVRRELVDRFGWGRVASGGLRVYTTIDPAMQQAAERALEAGLVAIEKRSRYKHQTRAQFLAEVGGVVKDGVRPPYLQGGVVAMDPRSGEVRVMVGGRTFTESRFNRAVQARRQPGSAFKPFVYAAALESGLTPATPDHRPPGSDRHAAGRLDAGGRAPRIGRDDGAHGAADVEQPRRGPGVPERRHREGDGGHRPPPLRQHPARAVDGARLGRGDAAVADRRLCHVRQRRPAAASVPRPPRRGLAKARCSTRRRRSSRRRSRRPPRS